MKKLKTISVSNIVILALSTTSGDESNIGFILVNCRTLETKYFAVSGAEKYSAKDAAEGAVANYGYKASFPSLINVKGIPTYIMVLKDDAGLVKRYAMVSVEKYDTIAIGESLEEVLDSYKELMGLNGLAADISESEKLEVTATVAQIEKIVSNGNTYIYVLTGDGELYRALYEKVIEQFMTVQSGDEITISNLCFQKCN